MLYIYTNPKCSRCVTLKAKYDASGTKYVERDATRLSLASSDYDNIDKEGLMILQTQNQELPVVVDDAEFISSVNWIDNDGEVDIPRG